MKKETIQAAFKSSIPIMMGYVVLGIAFGMLLNSKGFGLPWALLMSICIYAGSMQFVTIDLLASGASLLSAAIMTLLINARHFVYGLSMINKYEDMGKRKPYMIFSLTDETYSLLVGSSAPEGCDEKDYYFYVSLFDQFYWVLGSVLGSLIGSVLPINTTGMDFAMTALFVTIVVNQFLDNKDHIYNYLGFVVSIIGLLLFGSSNFIIPSMIFIIIGLILLYYKKEESGNE